MVSVPMRRDYPDEELRALILNFIMRKGRWGKHYFPIDTMSNWLGQVIKNNGKNVRRKIKDLANEGYLILHKGNTTASLNPQAKQQIMEYIDRYLRQ
jgi:hypothetical protein